ncbi:MAG: hypothetical protein NT084_13990 [Bacteroidetes bacterium]|nr:hypothetical protein [Bacteroidota bacterium]
MKYSLPFLIILLISSCTKTIVKPKLFVVDVKSVVVGNNLSNLSTIPVFSDAQHGLIFTYENAQLLKTNDAGETWTSCFDASSIGSILNIQFPNKDTAFFTIQDAPNHHCLCYRSTDACATWTQVFTLNQNCYLNYYNGKHGFAVSAIPPAASLQLLETSDAGTSWTVSSGTLPALYTSSIQFFDHSIGFGTSNGFFYKTIDGGTTWTSLGDYQERTPFAHSGKSFKTNYSDRGIYRTLNYGTTWTQVWVDSGHNFTNLTYCEDGKTVVASSDRCLMISIDNGETWHFPLSKDGTDFSHYIFKGFVAVDDHTIIGAGGPETGYNATILKITF